MPILDGPSMLVQFIDWKALDKSGFLYEGVNVSSCIY